jgi:predicted nucleotidyltransferase component of viral defense system
MLVAAMVGLDARSTMDIDATIHGKMVSADDISDIISEIVAVPIDDGVKFVIKSISEIMDEAEYPGLRVSLESYFDGVRTPLKIDISTGDIITPREIRYRFRLMFEDRSIEVWAYNLETVLAEKIETLISRTTTTNSRMRDFYDIYILTQLYGTDLDVDVLTSALAATAGKRGHTELLKGCRKNHFGCAVERRTSRIMAGVSEEIQLCGRYPVECCHSFRAADMPKRWP